jgi:hypothetical protein
MLGLMKEKGKIASLILSERPKIAEEKEVSPGLEGDFKAAYESCAKNILQAIKADDEKLLASALHEFDELCEKEEEYSGSEQEVE